MSHRLFIQRAVELSLESVNNGTGPFGCVVVKNGKIIAEGHNQVTSSNDPSAHAEVVAIRSACKKLKDFQLTDCIVYTSTYPCPMCLGLIYWARPKKVYYANSANQAAGAGFDDQFIYDELQLPVDQRRYASDKIDVENSLLAFEEWKKKDDKINY